MSKLSRREFLKYTNASTLALSLRRLTWVAPTLAAGKSGAASLEMPDYDSWEDIYRHQWQWDKVVKSTHHVNCWYQRGCTFNVYVKDGIVLREEQSATYDQTSPDVPDANPRGCQKGACYSDRMYDAGRLKYPLKRVGKRGEGKWKRVSWDEAMTEIADRFIDALNTDGPASIYFDGGGGATSGGGGTAAGRRSKLLDLPGFDIDAEVGDHHPGINVTCGKMFFHSSGDDSFYSDLILNWGGNPIYTQIPNAHYITEARYNGARIVTIAPDHNASAVHSDDWIPVNVGSDAAFGLAMAQVVIEEDIFDKAFVREQSDLPILVRTDNKRFLRASDIEPKGDEEVFYIWDQVTDSLQAAPRQSLALGDLVPALEGEFSVETSSGSVTVTPVFAMLREHLKDYTPEITEKATGTRPSLVRNLARQIATAKSAAVLTQSNFSKFYHGLEMERAQLLIMVLCGQFGKKGSGLNAFPMISPDGSMSAIRADADDPEFKKVPVMPKEPPLWQRTGPDGTTFERMVFDMMRKGYMGGGSTASSLFFHEHGGLAPMTGSAKQYDPYLKRDATAHLEEAYEKGWQVHPGPAPKVFVESGGNILRRVRGDLLKRGFLDSLPFLVTIDWRMSTTALYSDYVLPAAGWYETNDLVFSTPIAPFTNITQQIVQPLGDSKTDWAINCLLMEKIQERAIARDKTEFKDRAGQDRKLDRVYEDFSFNRTYEADGDEELLKNVIKACSNLETSWEELQQKGQSRFTDLSFPDMATEIKADETITACTWHTEKKMPWPTLTRRMQFYIDQKIFFELGEALPVHKDNPAIGGNYPLQLTGGHTRWSIHSIWRDNDMMLGLQQGEPTMWVSAEDARSRGISDGDRVRVSNDVGEFKTRIKISPSIRPGQVVVYHAWEPYQFEDREHFQSIMPAPFNPIQMVGGYSHLQPRILIGQPNMSDRGVRVEMERVG
ncbi:MAG: hypothetical protein CMQ19_01100 [Gammaproteobacteria bacterium]|nr:hypothetical protein [Gammaproteobacteria bacterium]